MIARISGKLLHKQPPLLLIDVSGVGYEIQAPMSTFYTLPEPGEAVTVLTHLTIRDDAHILFGFATEAERSLFRNLIKVNGVGPKMALTILSGISSADFVLCVQNRDSAALTCLPGIGKKTAERLVVEMQDRLGDAAVGGTVSGGLPAGADNPVSDAISALVALGYKPADASRMVNTIDGDDLSSEELIRLSLKSQVK